MGATLKLSYYYSSFTYLIFLLFFEYVVTIRLFYHPIPDYFY